MAVEADVSGDEGGQAHAARTYQVANCASLPYEPKMSIGLSGGVERLGHPAIHAVLTAKPGEANTRRLSVTLPKGELLDNAHIGTICTRADFAADACPGGSKIGKAEVTTPLLDQPLRRLRCICGLPAGPSRPGARTRRPVRHRSHRARRQPSTPACAPPSSVLPDAPVSRIDVRLAGGRKGLMINSDGLCGRTVRADLRMAGQNETRLVRKPKIQVACGSKGSAPPRRGGRR